MNYSPIGFVVKKTESVQKTSQSFFPLLKKTKKGLKMLLKAKRKIIGEFRGYRRIIEKCREQKFKRMYSAKHSYW